MTIATIVKPSPIHGHGCFAGEDVSEGTVVWVLGATDERITDMWPKKLWEYHHAYKSHMDDGGDTWILSRDNAAWINFAAKEEPNLREGWIVNGEPTLVAARKIQSGEELTVGPETDGDSSWKMAGYLLDTPNP